MKKLLKTLALCILLISCSAEKEYNTIITTEQGDVFYNLEMATTPEQQSHGLMGRDSIAENGGMLFVITPIRHVTMWMKNTKIPLDIVYVSPEAKIIKIVENATPMSEEHLSSDGEVRAVIELSGGTVKAHGIKVGDMVKNAALGNLAVQPTQTNTSDNSVEEESVTEETPDEIIVEEEEITEEVNTEETPKDTTAKEITEENKASDVQK